MTALRQSGLVFVLLMFAVSGCTDDNIGGLSPLADGRYIVRIDDTHVAFVAMDSGREMYRIEGLIGSDSMHPNPPVISVRRRFTVVTEQCGLVEFVQGQGQPLTPILIGQVAKERCPVVVDRYRDWVVVDH